MQGQPLSHGCNFTSLTQDSFLSVSLSLLNYCLPAGGNVAKHPARQEEARKRLNWSRIINFGVTQY